ncbi:MAG: hypothetical protein ACRC7S_17340 [Cetobacterium sp.]
MINVGDLVKVTKVNCDNKSNLIGDIGIVLAVDCNCLYKYRVETSKMVYGFQEGEIEKIEGSEHLIKIIKNMG